MSGAVQLPQPRLLLPWGLLQTPVPNCKHLTDPICSWNLFTWLNLESGCSRAAGEGTGED